MYLTELNGIPAEALPIAEFRGHLSLGTGFSDDALQDALLTRALRAAIAQVETMCAKSLIARRFRLTLSGWRDPAGQHLPMAPLRAIEEVAIVDLAGARDAIDAARYGIEDDAHRPRIVARGLLLPTIPAGGKAEVTFEAGHGVSWSEVPADLAQAVLILAARHYEERSGAGIAVPPAVSAMLSPHRPLRLSLGGRR